MNAEKPRELEVIKQSSALKTSLAYDEVRGVKVIVKEVSLDAPQAYLTAFEMEIRVLQAIRSPWIPSLLAHGCSRNGLWLSETYMAGESLGAWLKKKTAFLKKQEIFIQILRLIESVHQAGYLYLDLKADNILIHQGHAVLIDFNAALPIGSSRPILAGAMSLPPEGADGRAMDEAADQIGLGRLYLLMFGPSMLTWIALSKDPRRRFKSLRDFEGAVLKSRKRKILLAILAGASVLALCIPLGVHIFASQTASAPRSARLPAEKAEGYRAADYCLRFENEERAAQPGSILPMEWQDAADAALAENHRPLAGYLLDHLPETSSFSITMRECLLRLLRQESIAQSQIETLMMQCPDQTGWDRHLSLLFSMLSAQKIALSQESLESLFEKLALKEEMSADLCRNAICYLLERREAGMKPIAFAPQIAVVFEKKAGAYYLLYTQSEPAQSADLPDSQTEAIEGDEKEEPLP